MAAPDEEMVDVIAAAVPSLTKGTNLFMGPVEPPDGSIIPVLAVFVLLSGGAQSLTPLGADTRCADLNYDSLQVWVRGNPGQENFAAGQALADSIRAAGHNANLPSGLKYGCKCDTSRALYLGQNERGCPEWSINFTAQREVS